MSPAPINIKLRCASWQQLANIYRRDLSRHAIFLKSSAPPPVGTAVRIDLTLPTESMIVLTGTVTEHVPEGGLGGRGPGIDIKLNTIPQSALWLIETALASARQQPPGPGSVVVAGEAGADEGRDLAVAEDELFGALTSELASLRKLNPFQVLGVGYEASDEDVRAAFAELTKRYHPDRFTRYTSTELRTLAAEIFILIRDAYRKLGDQPTRVKLLATLGARHSVRVPVLRSPDDEPAIGPKKSQAIPIEQKSQAIPVERAPSPPMRTFERAASPSPERAATGPTERAGTDATAFGRGGERRAGTVNPPAAASEEARGDFRAAETLIDNGRYDEALAVYKIYARKTPGDRAARAGIELAEGLKALAQRDRLEAAQRFESVLEIDPTNERAARELAEMRRAATNERKGLLSRLMGKKE